jgi:outer membrane protein OmpA-like peptidoglycan-associated protein
MFRFRFVPLALASLALVAAASAQPGRVLKDDEVTESKLIDALAPDTASPPAGVRTRSLRVAPAAPAGTTAAAAGATAAAAAAPARRDVSLLVTFHTNSAELTPRAQQLLDVVGRAMKSEQLAALSFVVEGHADPRGNPDANLRLSQARAESVRAYLVQSHGIDAARLAAVGKGDRELLNTQQPAAAENRRVTIVTRQ